MGKRKHVPTRGGGRGAKRGRGGRGGRGRGGGTDKTREEIKEEFKRRKYTKNRYPMPEKEDHSSSEDEEETPG